MVGKIEAKPHKGRAAAQQARPLLNVHHAAAAAVMFASGAAPRRRHLRLAVLGEILGRSRNHGYCATTNAALGEALGVSESSIKRAIGELARLGAVDVRLDRPVGLREASRRFLAPRHFDGAEFIPVAAVLSATVTTRTGRRVVLGELTDPYSLRRPITASATPSGITPEFGSVSPEPASDNGGSSGQCCTPFEKGKTEEPPTGGGASGAPTDENLEPEIGAAEIWTAADGRKPASTEEASAEDAPGSRRTSATAKTPEATDPEPIASGRADSGAATTTGPASSAAAVVDRPKTETAARQGELFAGTAAPTKRSRTAPALPVALADWCAAFATRFGRDWPLPSGRNRKAWGRLNGLVGEIAKLFPDADERREAMRLALADRWFAVERGGDPAFFVATATKWRPRAAEIVRNRRAVADREARDAEAARRLAEERAKTMPTPEASAAAKATVDEFRRSIARRRDTKDAGAVR